MIVKGTIISLVREFLLERASIPFIRDVANQTDLTTTRYAI